MKQMNWWIGVPLAGAAALIAGCFALSRHALPAPVEAAFHVSDRSITAVTLYWLEPRSPNGPEKTDAKLFHGHTVLGETWLTDPAIRKKIYEAFRKGVADHDGSIAAGFLPHHGLRIHYGKTMLDLVICFQCAQVKVYENGVPSESLKISTSPRMVFNEVLIAAGVPLSKGAE